MNCPKCGNKESIVKDSRPYDTYIRRRRACLNIKCRHRWSTEEIAAEGVRREKEEARRYRNLMLLINSYKET